MLGHAVAAASGIIPVDVFRHPPVDLQRFLKTLSASLALWSISSGAQMCQGVAQRSAGDLHQSLERRVRLYDKIDRT